MIWPHATKQSPCPICGKEDWCTFGDRSVLCQRVESNSPAAKGGWYHRYGDEKPACIPKAKPAPSQVNVDKLVSLWNNSPINHRDRSYEIASMLGVSRPSIINLGCCYAPSYKAWAFPMSDGNGNYIGVRLRNNNGDKWAVTGSRQGIFLPIVVGDCVRIAMLPEGPTDTAACLTLGFFAIGRPTCNSGGEFIKQALKRLGINRAVIVADNDNIKANGARPGLAGAIKLKKELGLPSVIWMPPSPIKDVREFLNKGGTKQMIENEIKNKVWSKS